MAVFWAVTCLIFSACNDLTFKFYARKPRSNGFFVSIIGITWLITACCFLRGMPSGWTATLIWGVVSGIFSVGGNLLMLEAMRTLDAGVCSTIYRLNMVPAIIGAALFLDESISMKGFLGIFCALLAIVGFFPSKDRTGSGKAAAAGFFVMICASLMRAGMGLSYRYGFLHGADKSWVVVINSLFWIAGGVIYYRLREAPVLKNSEKEGSSHGWKKLWGYGLLSGALVAGIVITMALSLSLGAATVILPIMQMSFVLTGILSVIFLKEKINLLKIAAMTFGIAAVLILSLQ